MKKIKSVETEKKINDVQPFGHSSEGSHFACKERFDKLGGKVTCCGCNGHECKLVDDEIKNISLYCYNKLHKKCKNKICRCHCHAGGVYQNCVSHAILSCQHCKPVECICKNKGMAIHILRDCPVHGKPLPNPSSEESWEGSKRKPTEAQLKYWASLRGLKNEKAPNWKGDRAGKSAVHNWLEANYGKPSICENPYCKKKSKWFDWAKKTDAEYVKDRNAFLRLCRSCHRTYDLTPEKREQAIKNLWWQYSKTPDKVITKNLWWNKNHKKMEEYNEKHR